MTILGTVGTIWTGTGDVYFKKITILPPQKGLEIPGVGGGSKANKCMMLN